MGWWEVQSSQAFPSGADVEKNDGRKIGIERIARRPYPMKPGNGLWLRFLLLGRRITFTGRAVILDIQIRGITAMPAIQGAVDILASAQGMGKPMIMPHKVGARPALLHHFLSPVI